MEFLDTNIIIRYLTQDDPNQAQRALALLQQVEMGDLLVTTSEAVILEAVFVLSSKTLYNLPRALIQARLSDIITLRGLRLSHKKSYLRALDLYVSTNLDFTDALNVAHMERAGISTIISFDQDYDRISSILRREP